jgi:hypothetical protein
MARNGSDTGDVALLSSSKWHQLGAGLGSAVEMTYEVFFAAFCRRSLRGEYGTGALEKARSLSSLFVDAAERVVAAVLFQPRLRLQQGRVSHDRRPTGADRFCGEHL